MLGTLTPLASAGSTAEAFRSPYWRRNIPVTGDTVVLRNGASSYSIDLSNRSGGEYSFALDESQIQRGNHEVEAFEIVLTLPAVNPPESVTFEWLDRWADFAGLWRLQAGKTYFISFFKVNGEWVGAVAGDLTVPVKTGILGVSREIEGVTVPLEENTLAYFAAVSGSAATFAFDTDGLGTEKDVLCFDLILTVQQDCEITFPVSKWMDFCYPARGFKAGTVHSLTFLTFDGGDTWIGRWNNLL